MTLKPQIPKDLGIKIEVPIVAKWINIKERAKVEIEQSRTEIEINEAIVQLADRKIAKEKRKV